LLPLLLQAGEGSSSSDDDDDEPMEDEGGSDFELDLSDDEGRPKKKGKKGAAAKVGPAKQQGHALWPVLPAGK
jgi:hypothetical protein